MKNVHKVVLSLLLCLARTFASAQCQSFELLMDTGNGHLQANPARYQEALKSYMAAVLACPEKAGQAQTRLAAVFEELERMKTKAEKSSETALAEAEKQKEIARSHKEKSDKFVNTLFFYKDRYALVFGEIDYSKRFFFIDKNGDLAEKLGEWDKASQFGEDGFAKTSKNGEEYILDTAGNAYRVAYKLIDLSPEITALDLSAKRLVAFPEEIFSYPQLEVLILSGHPGRDKLKALPKHIKRLANLKVLRLQLGSLNDLPIEIEELKNLQELDLSDNDFDSFPTAICGLTNLRKLNLSHNKLTALPEGIGNLTGLTELYLANNLLAVLPTEIGNLKKLKNLDLSINRLTALLPEIGQLDRLTELDLSMNLLNALPKEFFLLADLTVLNVSYNHFTSLPPEIGQLKNLTGFGLWSNQLSDLPPEIGQLTNLEWLALSDNPLLTVLPPEIGQLKGLKYLILEQIIIPKAGQAAIRALLPDCKILFGH